MSTVTRLPQRSEVPVNDTWDLQTLFDSDDSWESGFEELKAMIPTFEDFRGKLGESPATLLACLEFDMEFDKLCEKVFIYANLRTTEDQAESRYQAMLDRCRNLGSEAGQAASYIRPEILDIPDEVMSEYMKSDELQPHRLSLERLLKKKKHTLSDREERLLAMQSEMAGTANKVFHQLHDADLKFGFVEDEEGEQVELSNSTLMQFLLSSNRDVRRTAFLQYYEQFEKHENTFAATLAGSIQGDVFYAKARNYDSALAKALFPDEVPGAVYENLIASVRERLPAVHHYFDVRRRKMGLDDIHHYDTYVPILNELKVERDWDTAVDMVLESLRPLGHEYLSVLEGGLRGRWCDRYPNQGKQSGAFSCGSFSADPFIMMNYKPSVMEDIFTLTHEAGHSMHSHYSASHQPYQYYNYTIFVAEVASTFNEQLLSHYLVERAESDKERAYLLNREIDSIRATIVRQTMFAEFEKTTHEMAERGEPLTVEAFKQVYGDLLQAYFGPDFVIDEQLRLECLRIPHFYRAFYVYKYATGLAAAIALSERVLNGGEEELNDYMSFLKGGCSKDPLDLLRGAGVDMEQPEPIVTALQRFESLVEELDQLLS